jgi:hypothetical protein
MPVRPWYHLKEIAVLASQSIFLQLKVTYKLTARPPDLNPSIIIMVSKGTICPANCNPIKVKPGVSPCVSGQKKLTSVNSMKSTNPMPVILPLYGLEVPSVRRFFTLAASIISLMPLRMEKPWSVTPPAMERSMRTRASGFDMFEVRAQQFLGEMTIRSFPKLLRKTLTRFVSCVASMMKNLA